MEESAGGEEPPAFSDDEADAEDEDSDDYSGLFDEAETNDQEEEISWDTLGLPETQTTQMSLFDMDAYAQETIADGQPVSSLGIQYSQEIVDEALRIGANDPNSRLIICAYFMKDKPLEENIRFLKEHYKTNGAGFYFQDRPYSIWYDQDGIRLSSGESAQGKTAFVISWEQAAVHIRELLDDAQYMTWDELTRVADFELGELADSLVFLCRDMDENGRKQNLLPSIRAIQSQRLTFPDERDAVMELLRQPGAMHMLEEKMTDGYQGYNNLPGITRTCCWAHVRRYFNDAVPQTKKLYYAHPAVQGVVYCDKLFEIERYCKEHDYSYEQRYEYRLKKAPPILSAFWSWLEGLTEYDKGSRLGKAIQYALNRRPYLDTYLEDGRCSLSNNLSENAIRPFTVGRKNWLFSDTSTGAHASARIYTMVEMAKAHSLNIENYLVFLLNARPRKGMSDNELEQLLPWSENARANCAPAFAK